MSNVKTEFFYRLNLSSINFNVFDNSINTFMIILKKKVKHKDVQCIKCYLPSRVVVALI